MNQTVKEANLEPAYKPIRFQLVVWKEIQALADELAKERGRQKEDLTKVVAEAVKFYKYNRPKGDIR